MKSIKMNIDWGPTVRLPFATATVFSLEVASRRKIGFFFFARDVLVSLPT